MAFITQVIHITSWLSRRGGGIPPVICSIAAQGKSQGFECLVAGLKDEFTRKDCEPQDLDFLVGSILGPRMLGFSPELRSLMTQRLRPGGIVHSHGLWMYPGIIARKVAGKFGCPLVISPHGMLEPWALQNAGRKKRLAAWFFENRNLRSSACLHALCGTEAANFRRYGLQNPIAVIPNGINLVDFSHLPSYEALEAEHPLLQGKKRMLFLSRIHPKKGLPHLLRAWQRLAPEFNDWKLLIAGNDQLGHEQEMRSLAIELGLESVVIFLGPLYGEAKKEAMAGSDAFVLPSFSEGFSMAILEAAAAGLPVLMTPQCNFPELAAAGGAIEVQPEAASCEKGLRQILSLSDARRKSMGMCGRELIQKAYTWPAIAAEMAAVYAWLLGQGPKPDCVCLN